MATWGICLLFTSIVLIRQGECLFQSANNLTWIEAQAFCQRNQSTLIPGTKGHLPYPHWTGLYRRLSDWIHVLGCYDNQSVEGLGVLSTHTLDRGSVGLCQERCGSQGRFALKNTTCLCLNSVPLTDSLSPSRCDWSCNPDDESHVNDCGGSDTYNVYKATPRQVLQSEITVNCVVLGCYEQYSQIHTENCTEDLGRICQSESSTNKSLAPDEEDFKSWAETQSECKMEDSYLYGNISLDEKSGTLCKGLYDIRSNTPETWLGVARQVFLTTDRGKDDVVIIKCQICWDETNCVLVKGCDSTDQTAYAVCGDATDLLPTTTEATTTTTETLTTSTTEITTSETPTTTTETQTTSSIEISSTSTTEITTTTETQSTSTTEIQTTSTTEIPTTSITEIPTTSTTEIPTTTETQSTSTTEISTTSTTEIPTTTETQSTSPTEISTTSTTEIPTTSTTEIQTSTETQSTSTTEIPTTSTTEILATTREMQMMSSTEILTTEAQTPSTIDITTTPTKIILTTEISTLTEIPTTKETTTKIQTTSSTEIPSSDIHTTKEILTSEIPTTETLTTTTAFFLTTKSTNVITTPTEKMSTTENLTTRIEFQTTSTADISTIEIPTSSEIPGTQSTQSTTNSSTGLPTTKEFSTTTEIPTPSITVSQTTQATTVPLLNGKSSSAKQTESESKAEKAIAVTASLTIVGLIMVIIGIIWKRRRKIPYLRRKKDKDAIGKSYIHYSSNIYDEIILPGEIQKENTEGMVEIADYNSTTTEQLGNGGYTERKGLYENGAPPSKTAFLTQPISNETLKSSSDGYENMENINTKLPEESPPYITVITVPKSQTGNLEDKKQYTSHPDQALNKPVVEKHKSVIQVNSDGHKD